MEFNILNDTLPIHPAKILICGPSMSGKTHFVKNLLLNSRAPYEVLYIFAHRMDQPVYKEIIEEYTEANRPVITFSDIPDEPIEFDKSKKNIVLVDDLIEEAEKSKYMGHLLRDGAHHDNLTLILISHWCCNGSDSRRQRLQMDYMVLFDFPADKKAVHGIGTQICPGGIEKFMEVYNDATNIRYKPLIIDLTNSQYIDKRLKFRCGQWNIIYPNLI